MSNPDGLVSAAERVGAEIARLHAREDRAHQAINALLDDYDRLTRERDEAREVVGRVRVAMSNHPDPCAKHPEDEDGDTACGWKRAYTDVRAALDDDRASGRDQAARPSSTPKRPSEHLASADEGPHFDDAAWIRDRLEPARSVEWTFDGPAVRPSDDDEEGQP